MGLSLLEIIRGGTQKGASQRGSARLKVRFRGPTSLMVKLRQAATVQCHLSEVPRGCCALPALMQFYNYSRPCIPVT